MQAAEGPVEMGGAWGAKLRATKLVLEPQRFPSITARAYEPQGADGERGPGRKPNREGLFQGSYWTKITNVENGWPRQVH
jgi:hypothetical protein